MIKLDYKSIFEICVIHKATINDMYNTSGCAAEGIPFDEFINGYNEFVESLELPYKANCGEGNPYFVINKDHTATWYNSDGTLFE